MNDKKNKEFVRTLHSMIADFLRDNPDIDRSYYQEIWDWLEKNESEDERIRKEMIDFLKSEKAFRTIDLPKSEAWVAYLERQKEPNPFSGVSFDYNGHCYGMCARDNGVEITKDGKIIYRSVPPFIGQNPVTEEYIANVFEKVGLAKIVRELGNDALTNAVQSAMIELSQQGKQKEQKPINSAAEALGVSQKEYNKIVDECIYGEQKEQKSAEWSEEDEENFKWFDKFFRAESIMLGGRDIPQDKYLWFKSLRPQPKHEWSQEDEKTISFVIDVLRANHPDGFFKTSAAGDIHVTGITTEELIKKLKSLRPQPHWKPSEEQMEAVNRVKKAIGPGPLYDQLGSLLNDLKKVIAYDTQRTV